MSNLNMWIGLGNFCLLIFIVKALFIVTEALDRIENKEKP